MRHRERGVTFLGWIVILIPMAMLLFAAIRLVPIYLEYMKVTRTLEQVSEEFKGEQSTAGAIRSSIEKHFDIESVTEINKDDIKITKDGSGYTIEAVYTAKAPFISNVSLLVEFDKVVKIE